ncbi:MAG TPA: TolC family protein [Thermoguttaceae bacterium]|nr:TolC family protein [Thermoguttaceae bacterium]
MRFYPLAAVLILLSVTLGRVATSAADESAPLPVGWLAELPPADEVSLGELESIALAENPTLRQAEMRVRAARAKCLQEGLYPNPVIGYRGEEMGSMGTAGRQGGFLGQEIVTADKLQLRRSVAGHEVRQAEQALAAQRARVLNDVRTGAYDVMVAQRAVELNRQLVDIGREGVGAAERLLEAMEVSRVDVLQARIEADSSALRLHDAQNRHLAAWQRLSALLGRPQMPMTRLAGDLESELPEWSWDEAFERLIAQSPELAEAWAGVRRAQCAVASECAERTPNLSVEAAVLQDNAEQNTVASVEFAMPLTLYNRNQGNIRRAGAELIAARREVQRVELALQQRLATTFEQYANARHQTQQYSASILPNASESLKLIQIGYEQGEFDYLKLLTAQRTYSEVELAYLESLLRLNRAHVEIEGFLLSGGLQKLGQRD